MDACVRRELRMKCDSQHRALFHGDDSSVLDPGEDFNALAHRFDHGSANEHGVDGLVADGGKYKILLEAVHLTTKGVSSNGNVKALEPWDRFAIHPLCQNDHPSAGTEHGEATRDRIAEIRLETEFGHEEADRGAFTAGNDQSVEPVQVLWPADFNSVGSETGKDFAVFSKGALESDDPDAHGVTSHASREPPPGGALTGRFHAWALPVHATLRESRPDRCRR